MSKHTTNKIDKDYFALMSECDKMRWQFDLNIYGQSCYEVITDGKGNVLSVEHVNVLDVKEIEE